MTAVQHPMDDPAYDGERRKHGERMRGKIAKAAKRAKAIPSKRASAKRKQKRKRARVARRKQRGA